MKFLKAIATPFVKLWNWIKQTAWVQPLLIVGCIFAVIFSIPYIASGIKNASKTEEDTMKFYNSNQISLKSAYKKESDADKFLQAYTKAQEGFKKTDEESKKAVKSFTDTYGEKFFFTFVGKDCEACENFSKGFQELEKNPTNYGLTENEFKLKALIIDEEFEDEEKKEYKEISSYRTLFNNNTQAFAYIHESGIYGKYYTSNLGSDKLTSYKTRITNIMTSESEVEVPLVCLFDLTKENTSDYIASQVFYELDSSAETDIDKASYLAKAWNYSGEYFKHA